MQFGLGRLCLSGAMEGRQRAVLVLVARPVPGVPAAGDSEGGAVDQGGLAGPLPAALGLVLLRLRALYLGAQLTKHKVGRESKVPPTK